MAAAELAGVAGHDPVVNGAPAGLCEALPVVVALDANGDGELSTDEIEKAEEALAKLDKNGDGKLSGDEVRPSRGGSQRERRPGDQAQGTEKSGDEVARILEFGSEEDIADLAAKPVRGNSWRRCAR